VKSIEVHSPAKVNLSLAVTGRRADGFHELLSLAAPLEFGDTLEVSGIGRKGAVVLECDAEGVPTDASNLATRAAERFRERYGVRDALRIRIAKRIPSGAGLGGGSGNAAMTLVALSKMFGQGTTKELESLAAEIGSDCPLFLRGRPLVMRGRGEILDELPDDLAKELVGRELFLFKPGFSISTKWAYRSLLETEGAYADSARAEARFDRWLRGGDSFESLLDNTFETVTDRKFPALPLMREAVLSELGVRSLMSGSGSCHFALEKNFDEEALRALARENWGDHCFFRRTRIAFRPLTPKPS